MRNIAASTRGTFVTRYLTYLKLIFPEQKFDMEALMREIFKIQNEAFIQWHITKICCFANLK